MTRCLPNVLTCRFRNQCKYQLNIVDNREISIFCLSSRQNDGNNTYTKLIILASYTNLPFSHRSHNQV